MAYSTDQVKASFPPNKLRKIFEKHGKNYTDQQLIEIRDFLIEMAEIDYAVFIHNEEKERKTAIENASQSPLKTVEVGH